MARDFPSPRLRRALAFYALLWVMLMPVVLAYLWYRGRKDPLYRRHIAERFGRYRRTPLRGAVWVHAVSLGEMRSATPLVQALLDKGERVVTTHFTPAGRREAEKVFAADIAAGRMQVVWVPFDTSASYARFLDRFAPQYGLVMEVEIWPRMIAACHARGMPLFVCNAQYPRKSFEADKGGLRAALMAGFAGGFVKSQMQKDRFAAAGMSNIHITGELRFDQPIPQQQLEAAAALRKTFLRGRRSFTLTSVVEGEDALYLDMIAAAPDCVFVYVPRAPERFDEVAAMLDSKGLRYARRSAVLDARLRATGDLPDIQVLLGDSMGEMYFYLALTDRAIVGGGFHPKGAHNIIEPLALKKPVIVGPHIWTIEDPALDAIAQGVCTQVATPEDLQRAVTGPAAVGADRITAFYATHAGGVARTLAAIDAALGR